MTVYTEPEVLNEFRDCLLWLSQDEDTWSEFSESVLEQIEKRKFITDKQIDAINSMLYKLDLDTIDILDEIDVEEFL